MKNAYDSNENSAYSCSVISLWIAFLVFVVFVVGGFYNLIAAPCFSVCVYVCVSYFIMFVSFVVLCIVFGVAAFPESKQRRAHRARSPIYVLHVAHGIQSNSASTYDFILMQCQRNDSGGDKTVMFVSFSYNFIYLFWWFNREIVL